MKEPKTVLLVEDDFLFAIYESRILERRGYRVIPVASGELALEAMDKNAAISLILMDVDLGEGMDGTEAARRILKKYDLPVLFMSSHFENDMVARTQKVPNYGYIVKGTVVTVLDALITKAFRLFCEKGEQSEALLISPS